MSEPVLAIGDTVTARCTKCRSNSEHIVLALEGGLPLKVECQTCSRQHKYRPPSKVKPTAASKAEQKLAAEAKEWEELRPAMNSAEATAYSMTAAYKVNTVISHPQFGLGVVQRVAGARKMEVLFEDGRKVMRCK